MNQSRAMIFSVATYNVLAQAYVRPDRYPGVAPAALAAGPRRERLLDRIAGLEVDLLCLQEVEPDLFEALEARLPGHFGAFEQKRGRPEGAATFVRRDRFTLERRVNLHYAAHEQNADHLALVTTLAAGPRTLVLANTHLRWQPRRTPAAEHLGLRQLDELLVHLGSDPGTTPRLLAGDLNAISQSPVLARAERAGLALAAREQRPWDTTAINGRRRKIDYVLHDPAFSPEPRPLPALSRDQPMPSATEPSDHLPLSVDFRWC